MTKIKLFTMSVLALLMTFLSSCTASCTSSSNPPKDSNQRSELSAGEQQLVVVHFNDATVLVDYVFNQSSAPSISRSDAVMYTEFNNNVYLYVKSVDLYNKYPPNIETGYYTLDHYNAILQQDILLYNNKNSLNIDTSQNNDDSSDTILIDPDDTWLRASNIRNIDLINHNESTARPLQ